jgi:hypothetical protein
LTTWLKAVEILFPDCASPSYVAVIESVPTGSFVVAKVAVPPLKVALPSHKPPFLNVTVPVAPPGASELTVADNCTGCP